MADADTDSKPPSQDALVADIDRTRTDLARTIDAISDRVSPKKNLQRAMDQAREAVGQAREAVGQARDAVDQARGRISQVHPIVAGVAVGAVVLGLAVLVLVRRRTR
jgi:ElaB/YqjD/DUF883 family membrane-anchored ribosome-binding protein